MTRILITLPDNAEFFDGNTDDRLTALEAVRTALENAEITAELEQVGEPVIQPPEIGEHYTCHGPDDEPPRGLDRVHTPECGCTMQLTIHKIKELADPGIPGLAEKLRPAPSPRVRKVCAHCGSPGVLRSAWAQWDVPRQEWVLESADGEMSCCELCDCLDDLPKGVKDEEIAP